MSTDAVHEIERAFNDLDAHKNLHVVDKFVPRGSQEFREALTECQHDAEAVPQPRERSNTIDTTYKKPHPSVHFASSLVTTRKKNISGDDLHIHLYPEGILRHSRERSNTYDGTVQRPRKPIGKSPLCNDTESAVDQLLLKSPDARKIEINILHEQKSDSKETTIKSKDNAMSPIRRHKSESSSHAKTSPKGSPKGSPKIVRKPRIDSPHDATKTRVS